ncbi:hypothetical protein DFH09DRAFT_1159206, partial [Mycena vulgaris]
MTAPARVCARYPRVEELDLDDARWAPGWAHVSSIGGLADECTQRAVGLPDGRTSLWLALKSRSPPRRCAVDAMVIHRVRACVRPLVREGHLAFGGLHPRRHTKRCWCWCWRDATGGDWMTEASSLHDGDERAICVVLVFEGAVVEPEDRIGGPWTTVHLFGCEEREILDPYPTPRPRPRTHGAGSRALAEEIEGWHRGRARSCEGGAQRGEKELCVIPSIYNLRARADIL